jgi:hypothetical protein
VSSIHETAYPRFKPELTQRELQDIYTPSEAELRFSRRHGKKDVIAENVLHEQRKQPAMENGSA